MAVEWLEENGADRAAIGDIDLNIFTGRLGVFDLEVEKAGEVPLRVWRLTADVDLWLLIRKRFFVKSVWLYEANLLIKQHDDGSLNIGGIRIAREPQAEAEPEVKTKVEPEEGNAGPGFFERWGVGLNSFAIRNSTIRYQSSMFDERLDIKSFYVLNAFSWKPEQSARINFDVLVNQQPVTLSSDTRAFREVPDASSKLQISHLDLAHYEALAKQAGIDELRGLLSLTLVFDAVYETDKKAHFTLDANVSLDDFRLRQGDLIVENKSLSYQTKTMLNYPASAGDVLGTTKGQLLVQDQTVKAAEFRANYAQLTWNGNAAVIAGDGSDTPPVTRVEGNLEVADLQVDDQKANLKLAITKKISAKDIVVKLPNDINVGEIMVTDLGALLSTDPDSQPKLPEINLSQGIFKNVQFDNENQLATVADMAFTKLSAQTADKKLQLSQVSTINIEQAVVKLQESVSVKTVTVREAQALKPMTASDSPADSAVYISRTRLDNMQFTFEPQSLALQSIDINGLNVLARREADGSLYAINLLPADGSEGPADVPVDKEVDKPVDKAMQPADENASTPFLFAIGNIRIGDDSKIRIVDQSVKPHFVANMAPLNITVEQIDNTNPTARTKLDMNTSLNPGNRITVSGWLTPFAAKRDADINAKIDALDVVMFSPYSVKTAGYLVHSGRINATIVGKIDNDIVDANTKLLAQRLNLDATSDAARGQSTQALGIGMPIDAALALMKDKNGDITIEVPVSGNLEDPNFAIGPAFRGALAQAVKKASISYAAYALQPYGSILFGAKMLSKVMALRLESVRFKAGNAELDDRATSYLEKIAGLMNDRPGISITLCGNATDSDRIELRKRNVNKLEEELVLLAELRGDTVKDYLINQYGIAAERFFDCQPEVTSDESAHPEVKLGL
jgi:hypothetical protein